MKFLLYSLTFLLSCISFSQTIAIEPFATGLDKPVNIQNAGDDRLFIVELDGLIRIVESNGDLLPTPFLDIDDRVFNISGISERGLLGLAFHPNYETNGYFYVNYISNSDDTVISRFSRNTVNSADPNSELILLTYDQPFGNHNGGNLAFGPDGFLYIASGDGGSGGDPQDNGQDLTNLLGKILRIDVDNTTGSTNYAIPADNPFVGNPSARDEIWTYGLRNPWKFSFDEETDEVWIGDVGQNAFEEINLISRSDGGVNFGWRCYEGNSEFNTSNCPDQSTLTFPVAQYAHAGSSRCSVTGGYRYRGSDYPSLQGLYFFADYCTGEIGTIEQNGTTYDLQFRGSFSGNRWSTFGIDNDDELYAASVVSGTIFRIVDSETLSVDDQSTAEFKIYPNPVRSQLVVDFESISEPIELQIMDLSGRQIYSETIINRNHSLNLETLSKGVYFLKFSNGLNPAITKKIIKR